eukprot:1301581-Prymnesium_polylepis.1
MLGICPQHDILHHDLTAREHLLLFGAIRGVGPEACTQLIPQLLEQVRLEGELADRPAGQLSGGMQRRLSVAIAFVGGPRVTMLDEPT